jgi:predicted enzyme related to lactoylglutathione lyase
MASTHRVGQFTWRELMTNDVGKAKSFYGELFNWSFETMQMPSGAYSVIKVGERSVGGLMNKPAGISLANAWTSYLTVSDVDATIALTREHGGLVYAPPQDVPTVGRFAMIADPSGAVLSIIRTESGDSPLEMPPPPGDFCWETLMTTDEEEAMDFYRNVFAWQTGQSPTGSGVVFKAAEGVVADVQPVAAPMPSVWTTYVAVTSLEDARTRAVRLGANVINPRIEIPTIGACSPIIDPTGAQICLFEAKQA